MQIQPQKSASRFITREEHADQMKSMRHHLDASKQDFDTIFQRLRDRVDECMNLEQRVERIEAQQKISKREFEKDVEIIARELSDKHAKQQADLDPLL